jgi:hypothetical protein
MKKFEGQHNDKYREVQLSFNVAINFVVPDNKTRSVTDEQIEAWFRKHIAALEVGRQLSAGNSMQTIEVIKIN